MDTSVLEPALSKPTDRGQSGQRRSELERLVDRTVLEPTHPQLGTCWRFTGTTTPYGRIAKAQDSYTHRLGWKLLRGPIPEGKELHHRCGVYACWNPDHLELVTHAENQRHLRKTQCSQVTRCQEPTSESTQTGHEPVELATQRTSGRSGSASASARIPDSPSSDEYQIAHRRLR